jgi:hypothetical protein
MGVDFNGLDDWMEPQLLDRLDNSFRKKMSIFVINRKPDSDQLSDESTEMIQIHEKARNGNSLKKICTTILKLYHNKEDLEIYLNEFSMNLNIERRRIYDIINILEALDIVVKKSKNVYIWKNVSLFTTKLKILSAAGNSLADTLKLFYFESRPMTSKKKMLTYLTLKVLKLFYTTKPILSFNEIMKICEEHYSSVQTQLAFLRQDEFESKNRIRRLYDIINVFKALGLIIKISNKTDKKIYVWKGENGFLSVISKFCPSQEISRNASPFKYERQLASDDIILGKRVENSAFRLCQRIQGHEILGLKSRLSVQIPVDRNFA